MAAFFYVSFWCPCLNRKILILIAIEFFSTFFNPCFISIKTLFSRFNIIWMSIRLRWHSWSGGWREGVGVEWTVSAERIRSILIYWPVCSQRLVPFCRYHNFCLYFFRLLLSFLLPQCRQMFFFRQITVVRRGRACMGTKCTQAHPILSYIRTRTQQSSIQLNKFCRHLVLV